MRKCSIVVVITQGSSSPVFKRRTPQTQGKLQVFVHQVTQVRKNIRNGTMDERKCYLRWF
ncbi:hypothetical protein FQA47_022297 [Oryzias melastigma]|uniref:Uncharacterized protein n=1 Tax=Oryzias melastigma TaxID=30732 RepID=A0A834KXT6_ORYME|nr:hypothetical protein FQA47_022297 [Oryzias melastigma]